MSLSMQEYQAFPRSALMRLLGSNAPAPAIRLRGSATATVMRKVNHVSPVLATAEEQIQISLSAW